jgi:hypothetical protein
VTSLRGIFLALSLFCAFASAQGPGAAMGMLNGDGGGKKEPFSAEIRFMPSQRVQGQDTSLSLAQYQINGAFPLGKWGDTLFLGRVGLGYWGIDTEAVLPRAAPLPNELWNINLGVSAVHKFDNGWRLIASASGGSASDKPFEDINGINANLMGILNIPWGDRDSWSLGALYSPLGQVPFPIPIVSYRWVPSDQCSVNIGLPMAITYKPSDDWTFEASYMILTLIRTRATWNFDPSLRVYAGFEWLNQGFHLAGQPFDQRFFYDDKRLLMGVQVLAVENFSLDVSTGYAWDRVFREGEGFGGARGTRVDVEPGPFVAARVSLRW